MKDKIIKLYCDTQEQNSRLRYAIDNYSHLHPKIQRLKHGDYHYLMESGKKVCWEFKTGSDFLSSLWDNHLHNQIYRMSTSYDYTFVMIQIRDWEYLLESYWRNTGINVSMEEVLGAIASFNRYTTVVTAPTQSDAFYMMERQSLKAVDDKPLTHKFKKKSRNYALNRLNCIYGLGLEFSENIVKTLDLKTERDLLSLTIEDLTQVNGIGKKKAEMIIEAIGED